MVFVTKKIVIQLAVNMWIPCSDLTRFIKILSNLFGFGNGVETSKEENFEKSNNIK
jgi:hypothetical protein